MSGMRNKCSVSLRFMIAGMLPGPGQNQKREATRSHGETGNSIGSPGFQGVLVSWVPELEMSQVRKKTKKNSALFAYLLARWSLTFASSLLFVCLRVCWFLCSGLKTKWSRLRGVVSLPSKKALTSGETT